MHEIFFVTNKGQIAKYAPIALAAESIDEPTFYGEGLDGGNLQPSVIPIACAVLLTLYPSKNGMLEEKSSTICCVRYAACADTLDVCSVCACGGRAEMQAMITD